MQFMWSLMRLCVHVVHVFFDEDICMQFMWSSMRACVCTVT